MLLKCCNYFITIAPNHTYLISFKAKLHLNATMTFFLDNVSKTGNIATLPEVGIRVNAGCILGDGTYDGTTFPISHRVMSFCSQSLYDQLHNGSYNVNNYTCKTKKKEALSSLLTSKLPYSYCTAIGIN